MAKTRNASCQPASIFSVLKLYNFSHSDNSPKGWYNRGYLPHYDGGRLTQFLTYRLADSLPQNVLRNLQFQVEQNHISERRMLISIEKYLDQGIGKCYLREPKIAEIVEENLLRFADVKYKLHAWVIMPADIDDLVNDML